MKSLVIHFSVLTFFLLTLLSGVWVFLSWKIFTQVTGAEAISSLFQISLFIFVLILVFSVAAILLGLIFIYPLSERLREMINQLSEFKSASRLTVSKSNELSDVAVAVNQVIDRLEREITDARLATVGEQKHFKDEQELLLYEQKRIYEEKEKLEYVLSRITDGVIFLSRNRNVALVNKAAGEITGFNQKEAGTKLLAGLVKFYDKKDEILMDEYAPTIQTDAKDAAFMKKRVRMESRYATPKLVDLVCVQLKLIHTQDLGYMIVLHDLSGELEIEKKRTNLLASFAQELKQPLLMISNEQAQAAASNAADANAAGANPSTGSPLRQGFEGQAGQGAAGVNGAGAGIAQLSVVYENLLTAGEIDSGTITVTSENVDLQQVIKIAVAVVQSLALERQVSLQYDEPEDFSAIAIADENRIHQIVLNLLMNAIYYTSSGGSVTISLSQSERDVIMQFQDSGIGIPSEAIKDLFTKFFVVPNDKGVDTGIGLGLYVCKKLVELQNGKIWLDSVEGRGTVVSVSLPKAK